MEEYPFTSFFDACAGIGCFHSGIVNSIPDAKFKCIGMAEIESKLREIYLQNFGSGIPNFGSVHILSGTVQALGEIEKEELRLWEELEVPTGAILTAGFPCQPFSKSGDQLGIRDGMRGTVFDSLVVLLEQKKFSGFILENVENLGGPRHKEDFEAMITVLKEDYWVDFFVDSPHMMDGEYGLQHRQRVFILGLRKEEFHEPEGGSFLSEADRRTQWKKKECAWKIFDELSVGTEEAKDEYLSKGGTITGKLLQKIATDLGKFDIEIVEPKKKQELLKYLIESKHGIFEENMISTGSTITAHGWSKLVELYLDDTKLDSSSFGFVQKMESLRGRKLVHPNSSHVKALKLWNEFLRKLPIEEEPCSPVWSMEFDLQYDLECLKVLGTKIGSVTGLKPGQELPPYITSMFTDGILIQELPEWKEDFILKNRKFYRDNKKFLATWLKKIRNTKGISNTLQKFEWQCEPSNWIQMVNEMKKTFAHLKWTDSYISRESISNVETFCLTILLNLGEEPIPEPDRFTAMLEALKFEKHSNREFVKDKFLSTSGKMFTIKGLRIVNRLLRRHLGKSPRFMEGNVVQFRPSGIRFSDSETSPALVAIGQVPYLVESIRKRGIYQLSSKQAAYLQGIDVDDDKFSSFKKMFSSKEEQLPLAEQYMRLGNAVNVELIRRIVYQFSSVAKKYCKNTTLIDAH